MEVAAAVLPRRLLICVAHFAAQLFVIDASRPFTCGKVVAEVVRRRYIYAAPG